MVPRTVGHTQSRELARLPASDGELRWQELLSTELLVKEKITFKISNIQDQFT